MPEGGLLGIARGVIELDAAPAIASLNAFAAKARDAGTQAESSLSGIGRSLTGLGQTLSVGATLPIVGLFAAATKAAQDTASATRQVTAVYGGQADQIDRFAQTTAHAFGISEAAALQASAKIGFLGQNLGIAADKLPGFDEQLITAAGNLAKFRGADPSDVLTAMLSAMQGNVRGLRQYQLGITAADIQQRAMADSGDKNAKQLTAQEKAMAALELITERTASAQANAAGATDSLGFRMRVLHAELDDLSARVGAIVLPTLTDFAGVLLKLVDAATNLPPPILTIGVVVALAVAALGPLLILVGAMLPALGALIAVVTSLGSVFAVAAGAVALLLSPLGLVVAAIAAFGLAYATNFLGFRDLVNGVVGDVVSLLGTLVSAFRNGISAGLDPFSAAVFAAGAVIDAIFGQHSTIALNADKVINQLLTFAVRVRDAIAALTAGNFKTAFADAGAAFGSLGQAARSLGSAILSGIAGIDWGGVAGAVVDGVRAAIGALDWSAVPGDVEAALNAAVKATKFGAVQLGQIGANVAGWLVDGAKDLWDRVVAFATRIWGSNASDPNGGPGIDGTGGPAIPGRTLELGAIGAHIAAWLADGARDIWAKVVAFGKGLLPAGKAASVDLGQVTARVAGWAVGGAADLLARLTAFAGGLFAGGGGAVIGSENAAGSVGGRRATIDLGQIGANVAGWIVGGAADLVAQVTKRVRGLFAGGGGGVVGSENAGPGTTVDGGIDLGDWLLHVGAPTLVGWVETAAAWLQGRLDAVVNTGRDWIVGLRKWIVSIKAPVFDAIGGVSSFLQGQLDGLVNTGRDWFVDLRKWVVSVKGPAFDAVGGVANFLQGELDGLVNTGRDWFVSLRKWVVSIRRPVFDAAGGVANFLQGQLDALINTGRDWLVDLKKWVVSIKAPVFDAIGGVAAFLQSQLNSIVNTGRDWLVDLRKWVVSIKTPVFDAVGGVANFLQVQLDGLINTGRDWFVDLKKWTISVKTPAFDAVGGIGGFLQGRLEGLVNTGRDWFVDLRTWTVSVGAPSLVTWVGDVGDWLRGRLNALIGGGGAAIGSENAGASVFGSRPLANLAGWTLQVGAPTLAGWVDIARDWLVGTIAVRLPPADAKLGTLVTWTLDTLPPTLAGWVQDAGRALTDVINKKVNDGSVRGEINVYTIIFAPPTARNVQAPRGVDITPEMQRQIDAGTPPAVLLKRYGITVAPPSPGQVTTSDPTAAVQAGFNLKTIEIRLNKFNLFMDRYLGPPPDLTGVAADVQKLVGTGLGALLHPRAALRDMQIVGGPNAHIDITPLVTPADVAIKGIGTVLHPVVPLLRWTFDPKQPDLPDLTGKVAGWISAKIGKVSVPNIGWSALFNPPDIGGSYNPLVALQAKIRGLKIDVPGIGWLANFADAAVGTVGDMVEPLRAKLRGIGRISVAGIGWVGNFASPVIGKIGDIAGALLKAIVPFNIDLSSKASIVWGKFADFGSWLRDQIANLPLLSIGGPTNVKPGTTVTVTIPAEQIKVDAGKAGGEVGQAFLTALDAKLTLVNVAFLASVQIWDDILQGFVKDADSKAKGAGSAYQQAWANALVLAEGSTTVATNIMSSALHAFVTTASLDGTEAGANFQGNLARGLIQAEGSTTNAVNIMGSTLEGLAGRAATAGANAGNRFAGGISGAGGAVFNAAAGLVGNATAGISGLDFFGTGLNAGNSFANGLGAAAAAAFSAGFAVGQAALFGAQSATGTFSPSRKFIQLANDLIDGLLIPIRERASEVASAFGDLVGIPTTNLSAAFASLQNTLAAQPAQAQAAQPTQVVNVFPLKSDEYQKLITDAAWGSAFATDMVSGRGRAVALGR